MHRSSCLCGEVSWETEGPFEALTHCHCSICRKSHGAPFASYLVTRAPVHVRGRDSIRTWQSSPAIGRTFCITCGSKTAGQEFAGMSFLPAGNLEEDPGIRPTEHIYVGSKASWYDIADDLPRHEAARPGDDVPSVPDRTPLDRAGNGWRGSCACQAVTFRLIEAPVRAYHCHCGRCRKARSAAHASNLFVPGGAMIVTRGQDHLASFKVPAADRFTQAFCELCGSPMPWHYRERGIIAVPMGCLDDDPGIRPHAHIFVGSKAPWFDITDDLPRFDTYPA